MAIIFCYAIKIVTNKVALEQENNPILTNYAVLRYSFLRTIARFILVMATIFFFFDKWFYEFKFTAITNIERYKCLKEIF